MATGIVSLAMAEHGAQGIARVLFAVNVVAYVLLQRQFIRGFLTGAIRE